MDQDRKHLDSQTDDGRYRLLVDAITDYAIYMLDPNGIVTNWNTGAQRFKGYRADEIVGQHFSRFYTPVDREADLPTRALAIARTEGKFEQEGWRVRKNGDRFWAHVIIDPIWGPAGELVGYAKITRDLTERQASFESLRDSEEQFRLLVQSVTDYAIYRLDREGQVISWNAGAERIKQYKPGEIIGSHFSRFYIPEDVARGVPTAALKAAAEEGHYVAEGERVRKDGSRFRASVVIDPIHDVAGKLVGFAKITRDVTERYEQQQELEAAREALFQSQKMEAIGQLTGGVAHDFNNLLMAIQSSLALLKKRLPDDPQAHRLVDNAFQGVKRGAALTQRMLAFARRQELAVETVDPITLIDNMADLLRRTIGPSHPVTFGIPPRLSPIEVDNNQLEMALLNLAVNARDAMPDGGIIAIEASEAEIQDREVDGLPAGRYVRLSVIDQGVGMAPETLTRAREPFFTTKGVGKGTGLGLSMVHGLVEQMRGTLRLSSQLGVGTTAELWLPASVSPLSTSLEYHAAEEVWQSASLKILAVDDDALILMNTAAMLEDLGHEVIEAASGLEALARFAEHPDIDLLITDQAMPELSGSQLARDLRRSRPDLPIILASGYGELPADAPSNMIKLGKPFGEAELVAAVQLCAPRKAPPPV